MKKIVLSLAIIGGLVFTSCKKDSAQENLDSKLDSIQSEVNDTLDSIKDEVADTVESLEAKIKEAEEELKNAVTVDAKQAATKKIKRS